MVDLKLANASGLTCVETLHAHDAATIIIVLTGYASIATAVQAIKLGATSYLAKPANTDDIERAFGMTTGGSEVPIGVRQTSINTIEWKRINEVLADTGVNVSETARRLGMHRRTLARKLEKRTSFRKLSQVIAPDEMRSCGAAVDELGCREKQLAGRRANNSPLPSRRRAWAMNRFRRMRSLQKTLRSMPTYDLFSLERPLVANIHIPDLAKQPQNRLKR